MLLKPILSGRIVKWAYALVEYDLAYEPLRSMKGQVVADFLIDHVIEVIVGWVPIFREVPGKLIGGDLDVDDEGSEQRRFEPVQSLYHDSVGYQLVPTQIGLTRKAVPASKSRTQARTGKNNLELQMND
jgi:hypothetical protein